MEFLVFLSKTLLDRKVHRVVVMRDGCGVEKLDVIVKKRRSRE
jgi:hypothetical protein